jgi:hypothetical protein
MNIRRRLKLEGEQSDEDKEQGEEKGEEEEEGEEELEQDLEQGEEPLGEETTSTYTEMIEQVFFVCF